MKLSGVMIGTDDAKKLGEFYTKLFGKPGWQQDDWYGFDIGGGSLMIGPHSEVKGQSKEPQRLIISFVCDDVKGEVEKFKGAGAKVVAEPYLPDEKNSPDMWLATLADPDGNYLQLSPPWEG
jgi:predicted enzyme related to lactoylglutathione lyase